MNIVKTLFFTTIFLYFMGFNFSVFSMKFDVDIFADWSQMIDKLSYINSWNVQNTMPTDVWMEDAVDAAIEELETVGGTIKQIMDELDKGLSEHYETINPKTNRKEITVKNAANISNIKGMFEKRLRAKSTPELEAKWREKQKKIEEVEGQVYRKAKEVQQQEQQRLALERQQQERQRFLLERQQEEQQKVLLAMQQEEQQRLELERRRVEFVKQEQQRQEQQRQEQEFSKQRAYELERQVIRKQEQQRQVQEKLIQQIDIEQKKALREARERAQRRYEQERPELVRELERKKAEQKQLVLEQRLPKQPQEMEIERRQKELVELLRGVSKDKGGLSGDQQNEVVRVAIALIQLDSTASNIRNIFDKINTAIDEHTKLFWFPDKRAISAAKNNIFMQIYKATLKGFKDFADYFEGVANSPVDLNNTFNVVRNNPDIHWLYNERKSYFDLKSATLAEIANQAAALINEKNVPISVIEYMMDKELQEARKGKSPRLRSAEGLGIMKEIKKRLV